MVLQCLMNGLKDRDKVKLGKRVAKVDHSEKGVIVHCKDGPTFKGGVVIGADGVHSVIRTEMWRFGNLENPDTFPHKETSSMFDALPRMQMAKQIVQR